MKLIIKDSYDDCSQWVADYISGKIRNHKEKKSFVLGLPTGSTPVGVYKKFVELYKNKALSFKNVVTFNMDEYIGLSKNNPQSYYYFMQNNLFKHVDIRPENVFIPDSEAEDLEVECVEYENKIKNFGGVDLFLCGVGSNGHIAFNEPFTSLVSRTRVEQLSANTIKDNSRFFDYNVSKTPQKAVTVGIGTVMDSREIIVMATGNNKKYAVKQAVEGAISHACPITALQNHDKVIIVCDNEAANDLNESTIRYFKNL